MSVKKKDEEHLNDGKNADESAKAQEVPPDRQIVYKKLLRSQRLNYAIIYKY